MKQGQSRETWLLVTGDFVFTGGMDRANFHLARFLSEDTSREVHLVAHRVDQLLVSSRPNVYVHPVPKPLDSYFLGGPLLASRGRRVAADLRARDPHTRVLVNGGNCCVEGAINWVHYVHAAWAPMLPPEAGKVRRAKARVAHISSSKQERRALRDANVIIANSERTARDVVDRLGVEPARVHVVYYGTDSSHFGPPSDQRRAAARAALGWTDGRPRLAFIGALGDRRKGFDLILDAWRWLRITTTSWNAELVVIGAGAELNAWRGRCEQDNLDVRFLGFRKDVADVLVACDGLVAPTRYEAFGLGVQEALCCGLPVIVSREAGVAERIPSEMNLLIDPSEPSELRAALVDWRERLVTHRAMALAHAAQLHAYTWADMGRRIVAIADRTAANRRAV